MPQRSSFRLVTALFLAALPATAQEAPPPEAAETFFDRVAVDVVNVEVYVTDKDGEPVTDLGRDDFVVLEDGKPVEVQNFFHVIGGKAAIEAAPAPETPEPAERQNIEPPRFVEAPVPEDQRLHLVVYVDNFHIHPLNRNRVFSRLRGFLLQTVREGDEVMVASYDRSLNFRHPFTQDANLVNTVLLELEELTGNGVIREAERRDAVQAIYEAETLRQAQWRAKEFAEAGEFELRQALDALAEMLDSLAGLPGRKMLIHVSDGLPMIPGQDLYQAIQQRFADRAALGEAVSRDMSRQFMRIINRANSNRITFYTIDAAGLRVQTGIGAENPAMNTPYVRAAAIDGTLRSNLHSTLRLMASRTGGQAILNTNDVSKGLERIARDFDNYYSLGYRAPATDRGRYHEIEVQLKERRPGWNLRHRQGYRDKTVENRMTDGVQAYLMHGYQRNPLGVEIDLGEQTPADDGHMNVAIRVRVPVAKLVLIPQGDAYVARMRLYFGATDEKGRDAELQELPFELRIPSGSVEMAKQDEVSRIINATMRKGKQNLVIAVRDEISEERSFVGRFVQVGS